MPVPAVPEALSKGVIDATVIPWEVTGALKVPELVGTHTEFGDDVLYTTTFIFAMNQDKWDSLPDDLKAVIDKNSGIEFSAFAGAQMQRDDAPARKAAADRGNSITTLTAARVAEWKTAAEPVKAAWLKEMKEKGLDGDALLAKATALIKKHTAAQ
jgi:TRAP-type C4-dicarboxylate transport system substrate-binding protein